MNLVFMSLCVKNLTSLKSLINLLLTVIHLKNFHVLLLMKYCVRCWECSQGNKGI